MIYKLSATNMFLSVYPLLRIYLEFISRRKLNVFKDLGTKCQLPQRSAHWDRVTGRQLNSKNRTTTTKQLLTHGGRTEGRAPGRHCPCSRPKGQGPSGFQNLRAKLFGEGLPLAHAVWAAHPHLPPDSSLLPAPPTLSPSKTRGQGALWQCPYGPWVNTGSLETNENCPAHFAIFKSKNGSVQQRIGKWVHQAWYILEGEVMQPLKTILLKWQEHRKMFSI